MRKEGRKGGREGERKGGREGRREEGTKHGTETGGGGGGECVTIIFSCPTYTLEIISLSLLVYLFVRLSKLAVVKSQASCRDSRFTPTHMHTTTININIREDKGALG